MTDTPPTPDSMGPDPKSPHQPMGPETRALGLKLIIVGALAVAMWIPALFIYGLSWERSTRADTVREEIYTREGGQQRVTGPFLIVPVEETVGTPDATGADRLRLIRRTLVILPETLTAEAALATETRTRSIYDATVYRADLAMTGRFDLTGLAVKEGATIHWDEARLAVGLNDTTSLSGLRTAPRLTIDGTAHEAAFSPGYETTDGPADNPARQSGVGLSTPLPLSAGRQGFAFALDMTLTGGGSFGLSPIGDETVLTMRGDWPHPGFQGQFSPLTRDISPDGFAAEWRTSYLARATAGSFLAVENPGWTLSRQAVSVDLVTPGSAYQKVTRSLKYALLFMGLVFLTMFLLEIWFRSRAHPAQYILIGMAQVIFYLMVLALSEHIPFDLAFACTAAATVLLSGFYTATVFRRATGGLAGLVAYSLVYTLIWLLMRSEDYALLIGSCSAFTALAITMIATRNVDWYGARPIRTDR